VFVSTRLPRSISVPTATISALTNCRSSFSLTHVCYSACAVHEVYADAINGAGAAVRRRR
jgi:hypothetical protein